MIKSNWLREPERRHEDQLHRLAENYPFEKERRDKLGLAPDDHLDWRHKNRADYERCLASFRDARLVGWLELTKNPLHSSHFDCNVFDVGWELIENNSNEVREAQLEKTLEKYSNSRLHFQQPAENTEGRKLYNSSPGLKPAGKEIFLARTTEDEKTTNKTPPGDLRPVRGENLEEKELLELGGAYEAGRLHTSPAFPDKVARKIFQTWLVRALENSRNRFYGLKNSDQLVGLIVARLLPADFPARRRPGSISFIYVHPRWRRSNLGTHLLSRGEKILSEENVEYIELKVNHENNRAINFYRNSGYSRVTSRLHYVHHPVENTP